MNKLIGRTAYGDGVLQVLNALARPDTRPQFSGLVDITDFYNIAIKQFDQ